ncbi:hypothetical protein LCGC14_2955420, partial [marine sediment metagenome]
MPIFKALAAQTASVARTAEGTEDKALRSTRDGSLFVAGWELAGVMEGRGFMVNVGAFSTPVVGGGVGGTAIDLDAPELVIGVQDGTSILPIRIEVDMGLPVGAADDDEIDILIAVDQDKVNAESDGTAGTAEVIHNLNTLFANASKCYANSEYSATMTDPVLDLELAHMTKIFE